MDLSRNVKYGLDRLFALLLLVVTSPILLVIAIAIRIDSPGSALFLQERIGEGGHPFTIFKFRTMRQGSEKEGLGVTTAADDERITRIGRFLRRTSLDELPQLINILLGEMSFIGPRPTLRYQVETYTPRQRRRLLFRPGVTGWAQVHGRNHLTWAERIEYDLEYVQEYSLWMDLEILLRTAAVVWRREGTYAAGGANDALVTAGVAPAVTGAPAGNRASPGRGTSPKEGAAPADAPRHSSLDVSSMPLAASLPPLLVIGAGGHARVVIDAIEKQGAFAIAGVIDDAPASSGARVLDHPVLGGRDVLARADTPRRAIVAIGSPAARGAWLAHLAGLGFDLPVVVHPAAVVGRDVEIGPGSVLFAGAVINSGARLGRGVIVNTGASVDHDCVLGDLVHIAPGARLAGNVRVGERTHIGIGACVIQSIDIGADVIIGAGAAVVGSIAAGTTAVGVPARAVRTQPAPATPRATPAPLPRA